VRTRRPWRTFLVVFVATFLVVGGTATAGAYWTAPSVPLTGTAAPATPAVALDGTTNLATTYQFAGAGATSPIEFKSISLKNTGPAPLGLTLTTQTTSAAPADITPVPAALAPSITLWLWASTTAPCSGTVPAGATTGTLAVLPPLPADATAVPGNQTVTLCVASRLTTTVQSSQGQTATAIFTLTGTVGSWSAQATATAFVQQVYRVAPPGTTCTTVKPVLGILLDSVKITWQAAPNVTYTVLLPTGSPTAPAPVLASGQYTLDLAFGSVNLSGPNPAVTIRANDTAYGTSNSKAVPVGGSGLLGLQCR
jgi:hypothetical protein